MTPVEFNECLFMHSYNIRSKKAYTTPTTILKIYHHHHCSSNETWVSCVQVWLHNLFCHYQHGNPLFPSAELNHTVNIAHSLYFCYFILLVVGKLKYGTCNYIIFDLVGTHNSQHKRFFPSHHKQVPHPHHHIYIPRYY